MNRKEQLFLEKLQALTFEEKVQFFLGWMKAEKNVEVKAKVFLILLQEIAKDG
jgi:hypothetical protein